MDLPLAAFVPVSGHVLIMYDPQRPGTMVFCLSGPAQPICIVWEDATARVAWVMEANLTHIAIVA